MRIKRDTCGESSKPRRSGSFAPSVWRPVFASVFVTMSSVDSPNMLAMKSRFRIGTDHDAAQQAAAAYYNCLATMFASARRWHPEARLVLFTPNAAPEWFARTARCLDLEVVAQPFLNMPSDTSGRRPFMSSLYTLDAVDWIAAHGDKREVFVLLDADVILLGSLNVTRWAEKLGYLGWPLKAGYQFHGMPLTKYRELIAQSELPEPDELQVVGGEFLAGSTAVFQQLAAQTRRVQQLNLSCAVDGKPPLTTEEQVLSLAVPYLVSRDNSLDVANRIWTAPHYRTVDGTEKNLLVWHLPGEKGRGFHHVVHAVTDDRSWFWKAPQAPFVDKIDKLMGVTTRTPRRIAQDWIWNAKGRLRNGSLARDPVQYGPPW